MPSFFSALNPISKTSGVTFRATGHPYSDITLKQDIPDLTLDLVIPFLWRLRLPILDAIYETFTVLYGDHFDKNARGFGQKGLLDFTLLPLLSRKLIGDTYLEERQNNYVLNTLAWVVALPIKAITFSVALACTIALIPIIVLITLLRGSPGPKVPIAAVAIAVADYPNGPDGPDDPNGPNNRNNEPMQLSLPTAYAALHMALHHLAAAGIRTAHNIRRLLAHPQNLALAYAMEHLTHVYDENNQVMDSQIIFDFLIENSEFWTDVRVIEHLQSLQEPIISWAMIQREAFARRVAGDVHGPQNPLPEIIHDIPPAAVALKLPFVIRHVLKAHLDEKNDAGINLIDKAVKAHLADNPEATIGSIPQVENHDVAIDLIAGDKKAAAQLWLELKPRVLATMQQIFSAVYPKIDDLINPSLVALVETGRYIDLTQVCKQQLHGVDDENPPVEMSFAY